MAELIRTTDDKIKIYNAVNSVGAVQIKDCVGKEIIIQDVVQLNTENQDGETVVSSTIFGEDGTIYSTISPTIEKALHSISDIFGTVKGIKVKVVSAHNPRSKRDYLSLAVIK